jgi:hypothetical protein
MNNYIQDMGNIYYNSYGNHMNMYEFDDFNDFNELIRYYINEKNKLIQHLEHLETNYNKIIRYIEFLEKKYFLIDIKHSNTFNFLLSKNNAESIRRIIKTYKKICKKIYVDIDFVTNKISNIDLFINKFYCYELDK